MVDAHTHIHTGSTDAIGDALSRTSKLILSGVSPSDWSKQLALQNRHPGKVYTSFGLHPWYISEASESQLAKDFLQLETLIDKAHLVGETGLDAHKKWHSSLKLQRVYLNKHIDVANTFKKPLVLHNVHASKDILNTFKESTPQYGGMIHSFRGTVSEMEDFIKWGFYISLGPNVLKAKSKSFLSVLHNLSLEHLLIESDDTKHSRILLDIIELVANYKKISCDKVIEANYNNFHKLLGVNHGMDAGSNVT
ncbi:MAG: TatD family hydrolase [Bdellovibrionales bacterium]|nr:TatD family hydrolase [Bdellovibrionales bacterium]